MASSASTTTTTTTNNVTNIGMKYRFLGDSGLLVSHFGFGCAVWDDNDTDMAYDVIVHAFQHGVNFFDTAEGYGNGSSERVVGNVLHRGIEANVWTREDLVISTKLFLGTKQGPNAIGLSRKHIVEGAKASLLRLRTDHVDVLSCHRPEKNMPIEEIVRAMDFVINQGWAFYWGTSEWDEAEILEARAIADRFGLIRPITEQPQYNLVERTRVEVELQSLYKTHRLGLTTWSPLAFGLLTGKYAAGFAEGTRMANETVRAMYPHVDQIVTNTEKLRPIAAELGCSLAQLALAWTASNENVSAVLLGARNVKQLNENLLAYPFVGKITPQIKQRIEEAMPFAYKASTRDFYFTLRETLFIN